MDGVLIDTEDVTADAAVLMFREMGVEVKKSDFWPFLGTGSIGYFTGVANLYQVAIDVPKAEKRTFEIYKDIAQSKLKTLPGVHDFIRLCRDMNLLLAIGTSAPKIKLDINFASTELTFDMFDAIVVGEDIVNNKPAPDIYLRAAELIGLKPEECLVVEDAPKGIEAAKAAGCKCLALTTSEPKEKLAQADWIITDLSAVPEAVLSW